MFSRFFKLIFALFVIVLAILLIRPESREYLQDKLLSSGTFDRLEKLNLSFDKIKSDIKNTVEKLPDPLISKNGAVSGNLAVNTIVSETNNERKANNLPTLAVDELLTNAAEAKLDDMFKKQYFEHESPQGKGPGDVAEDAGYRFLTVGENLALGTFTDEKDLVKAWMDSPGHRANILGSQFTEIGIAAKKGMFKGENVWIAVQEFGKPLSICPEPNEAEKAYIESSTKSAEQLSDTLTTLRSQIRNTSEDDKAYKELVDEYNKLVKEYNSIITTLKDRAAAYNKSVKAFNECIKQNS